MSERRLQHIQRRNRRPARSRRTGGGLASLLDVWREVVASRGGRVAITEADTGATCTFAELDARARRWALAHASDGRLRRRAVVFALPNSIRWFETFLGIVHADGVALPIDANEPLGEIWRLAAAVRAAFVWDGSVLRPVPDARRLRGSGVQLIKLTSGTTGRPKPLAFTAAQLVADADHILSTMRFGVRDTNYALIPLGHSYGLGNLTLPLVARGVPVVCGSSPLPHAIAADFAAHRPTVFPSVPPVWRALAASQVDPRALRSLRLAISAGAPLAPETARLFRERFGRGLHNFYGSSETGGIAYDRTGEATLTGSVGTAMDGVALTFETAGRLRVTSAAVFTRENPRARRGVGSWIPRDIVSVGARGWLSVIGRRGSLVKISGRRVDVGEVAARLRSIPGVTDAWVGATEQADAVLGTVLVTSRDLAEIRLAAREILPAWKLPKRWATAAAWPTNARGKTEIRALRALVFS